MNKAGTLETYDLQTGKLSRQTIQGLGDLLAADPDLLLWDLAALS